MLPEFRKGVVQFHPAPPENVDVVLVFTRETFENMIMGEMEFKQAIETGLIQVEGKVSDAVTFFDCFDLEPSPIVLSLR